MFLSANHLITFTLFSLLQPVIAHELPSDTDETNHYLIHREGQQKETPSPEGFPLVFGAVETLTLTQEDLALEARVDTGADISSLDARCIKEFHQDGRDWVTFQVVDRQSGASREISAPVTQYVKIKQHGRESQSRPVVCLDIAMGPLANSTLFTLTDRSKFDHPVLLGRSYLEGRAIVDVSHDHLIR